MALKDAIAKGKFAVTAECGPLKGTDTKEILELADVLKGKVDGVNVTDQQSAVMRLGSLGTSKLLIDKGLDPIFQVTCRDRNRMALQSDLLNAWVLGVKNILALTGDYPSFGDHPDAKPVYDLDSVQLCHTVSTLNGGQDLSGNKLEGKTDFFCGAVVTPVTDTDAAFELQMIKMEKKIAAGAKFFQTQAVYDAKDLEKFMKRVKGLKVPILAGIIPLKSAGMAKYMNKNVAGIKVPDALIDEMSGADDKKAKGIEIAARLINEVKGICQGVHIMAIGWEKATVDIIAKAKI